MTLKELVGSCLKCGGTGQLENPILKQNRSGYGTRVVAATPVECGDCRGSGVILTEEGKVLAEFVRLIQSKGLIGRS